MTTLTNIGRPEPVRDPDIDTHTDGECAGALMRSKPTRQIVEACEGMAEEITFADVLLRLMMKPGLAGEIENIDLLMQTLNILAEKLLVLNKLVIDHQEDGVHLRHIDGFPVFLHGVLAH